MFNDFKLVLEVRIENLKQQRSWREQFFWVFVLVLFFVFNYLGGGVVVLGVEFYVFKDVVIDMMDFWISQQLQFIDEQDFYIQSWVDIMQNIELIIVELGFIFQQLVYMVKEQEEIIQRIDENVLGVQLDVEVVYLEIFKYFQLVIFNWWLWLKFFLFLLFFLLFLWFFLFEFFLF